VDPGPATGLKVALVIVCYNAGALLERCLAAVRRQSRQPDRLILVDNASSDGSPARARAYWPGIELIELHRNTGFAAANNTAIERCRDCEWIALLNPDAFPQPDWLAELLAAAQELPAGGSLASCLVTDADAGVLDGAGDAYHVSGLVWRAGHGERRPAPDNRREVFSACAAAALYRRRAFVEAGGFDEDYFCYNEDVDLGFRLRLAGWTCWYVPAAVVRHVGSAVTGRHSDFSLFHGHRNLVWTWVKNMPGPLLRRYLWQHLLLNLVTMTALCLVHRSTAPARAKFSALAGLGRVLRQRRAIQARRRCESGVLLALMSRGWRRPYRRMRTAGPGR